MYSITEIAKLSGVSTRTLRYYDSIGLLKPANVNENGYRMYTQKEIDLLQQILFYKQFDLPLEEIKQLLSTDSDVIIDSLSNQFEKLNQQKTQLEHLITTLEKTINYYKGEENMTNAEKFDVFKQQSLKENKELYGEELDKIYDLKTIEQFDNHWMALTEDAYLSMKQAENKLFDALNSLEKEQISDVSHALAREAFDAHKNWLQLASPYYSTEYHKQMLDMYLADERFTNYYTEHISKNSLVLLKEIVYYYTLNE